MRYSLIAIGSAALVAAGPAPASQTLDFGAIAAAPSPSATGPVLAQVGVAQTSVYDQSAAIASASSAVTAAATASATVSLDARGLSARGIDSRARICIFGFCFNIPDSYLPQSTTTTAAATATSTKSGAVGSVVATITNAPTAIASSLPYAVVPSTCTPVSWTNTFAFVTTDTACPQPYEVGTYCGFINPEDPCAPQPGGLGTQVSTPADTPDAFLSFAQFHTAAKTAADPKGYVSTFKDYNGSVSANTYLGMYNLNSYDPSSCAAKCDTTDLCTGFNLFVERDPAWNPDKCSCAVPNSITNYVCTLWGSSVSPASATNMGGWRGPFNVVIVGSNGYEKTNNTTPVTPDGWTNPQNCSSNAHSHAGSCISQKFFPGPFDVKVCAAFANSQNAKNQNWLAALWAKFTGYNPAKCNFFNAFQLKQDGVAKGVYCSLYAQQYTPDKATYKPGWNNGKYFGVESSWSFCSK